MSSEKLSDIVVDFEKNQPSDNEVKVFNEVEEVISKAPRVLKTLEDYKGCQDLAKKAMSSPSRETELKAFEGLLAAVDDIATFFRFSKSLEATVPKILTALASDDMKRSFESQNALVKQLADIFDFGLAFDQTRMMRPFISNDFSYYRRLLPKFPEHPEIKVSDDEANLMALFTAEHIPMVTCLSNCTTAAAENNPKVLSVLASFANTCMSLVKQKKFQKHETNVLCVRAMVGAIVVYDHVDQLGAFHKRSPVQIRSCISVIKKENIPNADGLLNTLRYSTVHFNDDTTPANVRELLE